MPLLLPHGGMPPAVPHCHRRPFQHAMARPRSGFPESRAVPPDGRPPRLSPEPSPALDLRILPNPLCESGELRCVCVPATLHIRCPRPAMPGGRGKGNIMRVMVIDDNHEVLVLLRALLDRMGHTTLAFGDGSEALQRLPGTRPDLVISDVCMPVMDGFEVAKRIAESLGTTPPRVLLMSASTDAANRLLETPPSVAIGLLVKPFGYSHLSHVVSCMERTRKQCPGAFMPLCTAASRPSAAHPAGGHANPPPCCSHLYAACPHYDSHCGQRFRKWLSGVGRADQLPLAGQGQAPAEP